MTVHAHQHPAGADAAPAAAQLKVHEAAGQRTPLAADRVGEDNGSNRRVTLARGPGPAVAAAGDGEPHAVASRNTSGPGVLAHSRPAASKTRLATVCSI